MSETVRENSPDDVIEVDLRNPVVAAVLAWAWPGAGHLYQRRYVKGTLFMVCILGTFFFGLAIAHGRSVYSSFTPQDRRWQYVCQFGVGTPSLLALVQRQRVIIRGEEPLFNGFMAPPHPVDPEHHDELADWHREYHRYLDLGTLYTMIAGLLNALVIFDAFAGPMGVPADERKRNPSPNGGGRSRDESAESSNSSETAESVQAEP
jgi:hypothetical protein